jgi:hypothetical protein
MSCARGHRLKTTVGLLVLGGAVLAAPTTANAASEIPPARTAPTGAVLTVAPTSVAAGSKVTVSGNKCRSMNGPGGPGIVIGNPPNGPFVDGPGAIAVDSQGTWKATLTIPSSWKPGTYLVRGFCLDAPGADTGFAYPQSHLTVLGKTTGTTARPSTTTTRPTTGTPGKPPVVRVTPRFTG